MRSQVFAVAAICAICLPNVATDGPARAQTAASPTVEAPAAREPGQDEARVLEGVLEAYVGAWAVGPDGAIRVTPGADGSRITLDPSRLAAPLKQFGFSVAAAPWEITASRGDDGMWRVRAGNIPPIQVIAGDQTHTLVFEGHAFDGVFDPAIRAFMVARVGIEGLRMFSRSPGLASERVDGPSSMTITGVGSGPGEVSAVIRQSSQSSRQVFRLTKGEDGAPVTEIAVVFGEVRSDITVERLRNAALLDLWSFLVARPSGAAIRADFEGLRARLQAGLPLFHTAQQITTISGIEISTPFGAFSTGAIAGEMQFAGIRPGGHARFKLEAREVTAPKEAVEEFLPEWSRKLLPREVAVDINISGFDLAAGAGEILRRVRADMPDAEMRKLVRGAASLVAPDGRVTVNLGPGRIVSELLGLEFSGDIEVMRPLPKASFVARAQGVDETFRTLQPFIDANPDLQKAMLILVAARGFGKALPDGRLEWVVETDPAGTVSVNGFRVPIPGMRRK